MTPPDRLRVLLTEPGFFVMPAVRDGLSANLSAAAGFKTAFLSGSCVAASRLGGPDLDLISFGEMFDSFNMVRGAAPDTLVLADGDHGYGNAMNVQRTVRAYGRAGAAAILIEDKITPRTLTAAGKPCLPREEARVKIRAAVEEAKESGCDSRLQDRYVSNGHALARDGRNKGWFGGSGRRGGAGIERAASRGAACDAGLSGLRCACQTFHRWRVKECTVVSAVLLRDNENPLQEITSPNRPRN